MNKLDSIKQLRDEMFSWAKIELAGQVVHNADANMDILISLSGIKHTLKGKSFKNSDLIAKNEALIMSVRQLRFFLETSKYIGFEKDKRDRLGIFAFHVFTNTFTYKNVEYGVRIVIRETTEKTYFYDQALIEKN